MLLRTDGGAWLLASVTALAGRRAFGITQALGNEQIESVLEDASVTRTRVRVPFSQSVDQYETGELHDSARATGL